MTNNVIRGPWSIAHQLGVSECSVSRYELPAAADDTWQTLGAATQRVLARLSDNGGVRASGGRAARLPARGACLRRCKTPAER